MSIEVHLIQHGEHKFTIHEDDATFIRGQLKPGYPAPPELYDATDTDRSDLDPEEYLTLAEDGTVLWQGWLGGVDRPAPPGAPRPVVVSGPAQLEVSPGRAAYEASLIVIGEDLDGNPLPWASLPPKHREAWRAAADAAVMLASFTPVGYQGPAAHTFTTACDGFHPVAEACNLPLGEPADDPADLAVSIADLTPEVLRDILLVVGEDIPAEVIASWTDQQRDEVGRYAAREHLSASDNPVTRLPRPAVLGGDGA